MAANIAALELWFFDDATKLNLLTTPFKLDDGGFTLGEVERDITNYTAGGYGNFFSGGFNYNVRTVNLKLLAYDFANSEVQRLYKNIEKMNNLYRFVEHPLGALYIRTVSSTNTIENGGYMKILSAEIKSSDELFTVARMHNQEILGQPIELTLVCEPFIYEKNFIKNEFIQLSLGTGSGGGYTYGSTATINTGNAYQPHFTIRDTDIRGDVPSPIGFRIKHNRNVTGTGNNLANIYIGTNYGIAYPDWIGTGVSPSTVDYKLFFNPSTNNQYANGNTIEYRYAGKCMAFLVAVNPPVADDYIKIEVKYQSLTTVDSIDYHNINAINGNVLYAGSLTIPFSGRTSNNNYTLHITSSDNTDWNVILIPSWNFRGYISSGYHLRYNQYLYDNPFDNTLFTSVGGAHYNKIGEGILAIPDVGLRGMVVGSSDTGNKWSNEIELTAYYNPRYLYIRNIL